MVKPWRGSEHRVCCHVIHVTSDRDEMDGHYLDSRVCLFIWFLLVMGVFLINLDAIQAEY